MFFGSARRTVAVRYPQRADLRSALTLVKARLHGEVVAAPAEADTGNDDGAQARYLLTPREREIVDLISPAAVRSRLPTGCSSASAR